LHNVLLQIGDFHIYTYSVVMVVGVLTGTVIAFREGERVGLPAAVLIDMLIGAVIGGVAGARLEYVLLNMEYFREQPDAAFRVWEGGFAYHGGLIGGILVLILYSRLKRLNFWKVADAVTLGFALSVAIGWIACFFAGCAYGRLGFGPLYFVWYDIFGMMASRFAVQVVGMGLSLLLFLALWLVRSRLPFPGSLFLLFLIISGSIHFALGFVRGDETLWLWNWRVDQWLAIGQVAIATSVGIYRLVTSSDSG
jgi:phosphatidylglycerol:prolipoprotein diacylglycerol transferase